MKENAATQVKIFGRQFQIKCPEEEVLALQKAAQYLDSKMQILRKSGNAINMDRIAIITALNIVRQLFLVEDKKDNDLQNINKRLSQLQNRIESALSRDTEVEL